MQNTAPDSGKDCVVIADIDDQHRELMAIADGVHRSWSRAEERDITQSVSRRLCSYARYHFVSEEGLFTRFEYPRAAVHCFEHEFFTTKLTQLSVEFRKPNSRLAEDLLLFLKRWIVKHIRQDDRKYGIYFRERGVIQPRPTDVASTDKNCGLGILEIDAQHSELIRISDAVCDQRRQSAILVNLLRRLLHYAEYHFATEEEAFRRFAYPETRVHKGEHAFFVDEVRQLINSGRDEDEPVCAQTLYFIRDWIVRHIHNDDRTFATFFREYARRRKADTDEKE